MGDPIRIRVICLNDLGEYFACGNLRVRIMPKKNEILDTGGTALFETGRYFNVVQIIAGENPAVIVSDDPLLGNIQPHPILPDHGVISFIDEYK